MISDSVSVSSSRNDSAAGMSALMALETLESPTVMTAGVNERVEESTFRTSWSPSIQEVFVAFLEIGAD